MSRSIGVLTGFMLVGLTLVSLGCEEQDGASSTPVSTPPSSASSTPTVPSADASAPDLTEPLTQELAAMGIDVTPQEHGALGSANLGGPHDGGFLQVNASRAPFIQPVRQGDSFNYHGIKIFEVSPPSTSAGFHFRCGDVRFGVRQHPTRQAGGGRIDMKTSNDIAQRLIDSDICA